MDFITRNLDALSAFFAAPLALALLLAPLAGLGMTDPKE